MLENHKTTQPHRVCIISDRDLAAERATDPQQFDPAHADSLWVVEQQESIDSTETQIVARQNGCDVLVCSFLRSSVAEIGHCDTYLGSMRSISEASGITVHCERDLWRACRELRGRLTARSVSVIHNDEVITVTADQFVRSPISSLALVEIIRSVLRDRMRATSAA